MPSTAIRSQSYDEVTKTLFVTFVDGDLYAYAAVPPAVAQAFSRAGSKGRFFAYEIRNRYRYRRMDPDSGWAGPEPSPVGPGDGPAWPPPAAGARSA
jgi:hypothetical protein